MCDKQVRFLLCDLPRFSLHVVFDVLLFLSPFLITISMTIFFFFFIYFY